MKAGLTLADLTVERPMAWTWLVPVGEMSAIHRTRLLPVRSTSRPVLVGRLVSDRRRARRGDESMDRLQTVASDGVTFRR